MNTIVLLAVACATIFLGIFAYVFALLSRRGHPSPLDPQWLAEFSSARYRPMERLLAAEDSAFLAAQPGFTRAMRRRFLAERRRIFRIYLRNVARDFERLHRAARVLMLCAPDDRPDYAAALVRERLAFERTMVLVRLRLLVNWMSGATVEVHGLVGALETMNAQVRSLAAAPVAV